jgi:hypothetical protein
MLVLAGRNIGNGDVGWGLLPSTELFKKTLYFKNELIQQIKITLLSYRDQQLYSDISENVFKQFERTKIFWPPPPQKNPVCVHRK